MDGINFDCSFCHFLILLVSVFEPRGRKIIIRRTHTGLNTAKMYHPEGFQYRTKAFITKGRIHFLMFRMNNVSIKTGFNIQNEGDANNNNNNNNNNINPNHAINEVRHANFQNLQNRRQENPNQQNANQELPPAIEQPLIQNEEQNGPAGGPEPEPPGNLAPQPVNPQGQPLDPQMFCQNKLVQATFLIDKQSDLEFQDLPQSKSASQDSCMEPITLRCFNNMIGVIYKVGYSRTLIIYEIVEERTEAPLTFEQRNFVPDYEMQEIDTILQKHTLRQVLEISRNVVAGCDLHDLFFLKRELVCMMIDSQMVVCRINGLNQASDTKKCTAEYYRVPIVQNNDGMRIRLFSYDRNTCLLYYYHGTAKFTFGGSQSAQDIKTAGYIDLKPLISRLSQMELIRSVGMKKGLLRRAEVEINQKDFHEVGFSSINLGNEFDMD